MDPSDDRPETDPADSAATDVAAGDDGADVPSDAPPAPLLDLSAIERDLSAVEAALPRLDDGSYWIDEDTGEPIPDEVLARDPLARRAP